MYSYLIAHTADGVVRTSAAPSEVFTDDNVQAFLSTLEAVDGWLVREVVYDVSDNVIHVDFRPNDPPF
jgi:hypothetical protein